MTHTQGVYTLSRPKVRSSVRYLRGAAWINVFAIRCQYLLELQNIAVSKEFPGAVTMANIL